MEYMTPEGYAKIANELQELIEEVPKVKDAISEARDKGDLSENFEYHAAKRAQGKLLGRIKYLQNILEYARIIDTSKLQSDKVALLRKVEITNMKTNARMTYTIVNPHEADMHAGKISIKSPIAQGLLDKHVGDVVDIKVPAGVLQFRIENISL